MDNFKSGFISIIGLPNVGKSTLLNSIIGQKVAIISPKAQTTRNIIRGIYTDERKQIVFLDTPGIHRASNQLGHYMNSTAKSAYHNVEGCLLVTDAKNETPEQYAKLIEDIKKSKTPFILIMNKIDLMDKKELALKTAMWAQAYDFLEIIQISAKKNENIDQLLETIERILPEGPKYYPEEMITDNPETFLIGEIIREKVLLCTEQEVPHSIAVVIERANQTSKCLYINATIICERDSQKGIIIGNKGSMIKRIGTKARVEIERIFQTPVRLETFVRVESDWRNSNKYLKEFGFKNE